MHSLNIDYGENVVFLDEELVLKKASFCNIACGYHAGDALSIRNSIAKCNLYDIQIGAHPSFYDREHFGRINIAPTINDLYTQLIHQLGGFASIANNLGVKVNHVKAHGALYNEAMVNIEVAQCLLDASLFIFPRSAIVAMPDSILEMLCNERNVPLLREGFGDRKYKSKAQLLSRNLQGAVLMDPSAVKQAISNFEDNLVDTLDDGLVPIFIDTVCLHGDNPAINQILLSLEA